MASSSARAGEPPFASLESVDIEPAGEVEVEQWTTWAAGKPGESFNALLGRTELEYGVTDTLQLSAGVFYNWAQVHPHTADARDPARDRVEFQAVSVEVIYQLLDPDTQPLGLALYVEPAIGPRFGELEAKLLLQKTLLDDRLTLGANAVWESEWRSTPTDLSEPAGDADASRHWQKETELGLLLGASYRFAPHWSGGAEFAAKREIDGLAWQDNGAVATSYFAGPTLHYECEGYWATLGTQAQLPWAANLSGEPGETVHGFAREQERYRIRLRLGFDL